MINSAQIPLPDTKHSQQQTSMSTAELEPTIPSSERPQTYTLNRAASWPRRYIHTNTFLVITLLPFSVGVEGYCFTWSHTWTYTHSVGRPWTRREASTCITQTFTRDTHLCSRRDSNPPSQHASGRRTAMSVTPMLLVINGAYPPCCSRQAVIPAPSSKPRLSL